MRSANTIRPILETAQRLPRVPPPPPAVPRGTSASAPPLPFGSMRQDQPAQPSAPASGQTPAPSGLSADHHGVVGGVLHARLVSPRPDGRGAVAAVDFRGPLDALWRPSPSGLGAELKVGAVLLRDLFGIDRGLVARWALRRATIFPHGGPAIVAELLGALAVAGVAVVDSVAVAAPRPERWLPEWPTESQVVAAMLEVLPNAASPAAVDLLLDQPRRWAGVDQSQSHVQHELAREISDRSQRLNRLINEPVVAIVGRPNIGKSSLLNVLAGRSVAIVADQPGTTRDHVGVAVDLGGVVVRMIDTPGLAAHAVDELDESAQRLGRQVLGDVDLALICADAGEFPAAAVGERDERAMIEAEQRELGVAESIPVLRVLTRCDRGRAVRGVGATPALESTKAEALGATVAGPSGHLLSSAAGVGRAGAGAARHGGPIRTSATTGEGVRELAAAIAERLVPWADRVHPGPWRFWPVQEV